MRSEESIRNAIKEAEEARKKSDEEWADFFENNIDRRPAFNVKVCGVTLKCSTATQEFDPFILGLRYALGETGE